jgi:hypothetical protein
MWRCSHSHTAIHVTKKNRERRRCAVEGSAGLDDSSALAGPVQGALHTTTSAAPHGTIHIFDRRQQLIGFHPTV